MKGQKMTESIATTPSSRTSLRVGFWLATGFFAVWMLFTAYAELAIPAAEAAFTHLGIPNYLRIEISLAKIIGTLVLLLPVPPRLKEWTYAGFAIDLISAVIAHVVSGDGPAVYMWAVVAAVVLFISYFFYRKSAAV
jgi:hypothetical protein